MSELVRQLCKTVDNKLTTPFSIYGLRLAAQQSPVMWLNRMQECGMGDDCGESTRRLIYRSLLNCLDQGYCSGFLLAIMITDISLRKDECGRRHVNYSNWQLFVESLNLRNERRSQLNELYINNEQYFAHVRTLEVSALKINDDTNSDIACHITTIT